MNSFYYPNLVTTIVTVTQMYVLLTKACNLSIMLSVTFKLLSTELVYLSPHATQFWWKQFLLTWSYGIFLKVTWSCRNCFSIIQVSHNLICTYSQFVCQIWVNIVLHKRKVYGFTMSCDLIMVASVSFKLAWIEPVYGFPASPQVWWYYFCWYRVWRYGVFSTSPDLPEMTLSVLFTIACIQLVSATILQPNICD